MTKVIYVGRHGAVDVPCPDGRVETVSWGGDPLETTPEHAAALLEQGDNWKPAPRQKPAAGNQAAKAAKEEE